MEKESVEEKETENISVSNEQESDKLVAVLAYLSLIGFIIAIVLNASKKEEDKKFGAFHLRQALGLLILGLAFLVVDAVIKTTLLAFSMSLASSLNFISFILSTLFLAFTFFGVWNAINGEEKKLPLVGHYFAGLLKNTFE